MSQLVKHAERELKLIYPEMDNMDSSDPDKLICDNILEIVRGVAGHGHSGPSIQYLTAVIKELLLFKPLTPLTGDDSEWRMVTEGLYQNNRYYSVFKDVNRFDGQAYDIDAHTNDGSVLTITFPYLPER